MRLLSPGLTASIVICVLTTGCGGGGGGSDTEPVDPPTQPPPPVNPPTPPAETFTLSGTITASGSQDVDGDTNDPTRVAVSNDTVATPQDISNPITIGGYVNLPGAGPDGRSKQLGDRDDYFRVSLLEGQTVTMLVADFDQADADLYLYDTAGNILDFSIDTGDVETLIVPADGTYLVNAFAVSGATNYILAIGAPNITSGPSAQTAQIIPWEAIVEYKTGPTAAGVANVDEDATQSAISKSMGAVQRAGGPGRGRLLALQRSQVSAAQLTRRLGVAESKLAQLHDPQLRARWETLLTIKSLRKDPRVRYAEPNYRVKATAAPNDPGYPTQWHYPLIGLPDAWETTTGKPDVIVAVVDTGILANHPDLAGQLVAGYDFVSDADSSLDDDDGIDPNPEDPGGTFGGGSSSFHGTHVSGTVAARGNNQLGVAGSAYGSRVMPVRALGADGGGTTYDVDQAVRFAAGLDNDSNTVPATPASIINLSLGGGPFVQATQNLYNQVRAAGIMVVAAAGNEGSSILGYPASYANVISVSAVDAQRNLASYSNTGTQIDVSAPGGDNSVDQNGDGFPDGVLSTGGSVTESGTNFVYSFLNGTSMAAPHVAGILALMKSVNPALTPDDVDAMLSGGQLTEDLGIAGRDDRYGHGIINAQLAVLAAVEATGTSPADNPRLVSSASSINFGSTTTTLEVLLRNGGKGDLTLEGPSVSEPWLQITPADVDEDGLGTYQIEVDRTDLSVGIYTANINAESSSNNLVVRVLASVGAPGADTDVGVIYILLYDPVLNLPVAQFASGGDGDEYPYQFTNVAPGEYEIIAGSDADNDLLICDAGEACGAWLSTDKPILIEVDDDATDLDFPVEYLVSIPQLTAQSQADNSRTRKINGRERTLSQ